MEAVDVRKVCVCMRERDRNSHPWVHSPDFMKSLMKPKQTKPKDQGSPSSLLCFQVSSALSASCVICSGQQRMLAFECQNLS